MNAFKNAVKQYGPWAAARQARNPGISFDCAKEEALTISKIVALVAGRRNINMMELEMDITAVHCNGNPLKLQEFLEAYEINPSSFWHDITGILWNINRETGKLDNFFVPRHSQTC